MGAESKFLATVGNYNQYLDEYRSNLEERNRSRALLNGLRAAGSAIKRVIYAQMVTFDYVTNYRAIEPLPPLDERLSERYGYPGSTVGLAARLCMWHGKDLPPSFEDFVERDLVHASSD